MNGVPFAIDVCVVNIPQSKEFCKAFRQKKAVDAYESSKGFMKVSKLFETRHSTVRQIINKISND